MTILETPYIKYA